MFMAALCSRLLYRENTMETFTRMTGLVAPPVRAFLQLTAANVLGSAAAAGLNVITVR